MLRHLLGTFPTDNRNYLPDYQKKFIRGENVCVRYKVARYLRGWIEFIQARWFDQYSSANETVTIRALRIFVGLLNLVGQVVLYVAIPIIGLMAKNMPNALYFTMAIWGAAVIRGIHGNLSKTAGTPSKGELGSARNSCALALRTLFKTLEVKENTEEERNRAKRRLAECLLARIMALLNIRAKKWECRIYSVSNDAIQFRVCATASSYQGVIHTSDMAEIGGNEGRMLAAEGTLLKLVAEVGRTFRLCSTDLKWHPFKLDVEGMDWVKSKMIVPVFRPPEEGNALHCVGLVSILTDRPFTFYNVASRAIDDELNLYFSLVSLLIGHDCGRFVVRTQV